MILISHHDYRLQERIRSVVEWEGGSVCLQACTDTARLLLELLALQFAEDCSTWRL